jgi:glycosyltransferase involved in cell wall biosynthesis
VFKVTFLTPTLEMHGGNIIMLRYIDVLLKNGFEVTIITTDKPVAFSLDKRIKVIKYHRVKIKYLDFFFFQLVYLRRIIRLISDCDVIIPIYTPLWIHAILARKIKKINCKIIPIFQDSLDTLWVGPYIRLVLNSKIISRNIDGVFYVSKLFKDVFKRYFCGKYYIPNGIDFNEFIQGKGQNKSNYVLFVGRPNKPKGFDVFKKSFSLIRKEYPDIYALVISPNVENKKCGGIQYVKYKSRKQLADLYQKAVVYICASRAESFGLTSLEAMACGTPVITTKNGGHINYAEDGSNCILVNNGDYKGIYNAFVKIVESNSLQTKLVGNGIKTVKKFEWKKSEKMFLKVLLDFDKSICS